jgi:hypothetical protein
MRNDQHGGGVDEELPTICSACGSVVDPSEWHPTRTTPDEDGAPQFHVFCDEDCLDE